MVRTETKSSSELVFRLSLFSDNFTVTRIFLGTLKMYVDIIATHFAKRLKIIDIGKK